MAAICPGFNVLTLLSQINLVATITDLGDGLVCPNSYDIIKKTLMYRVQSSCVIYLNK